MDLSIIIPAYNEKKRLPPTLDRTLAFLAAHFAGSYEIVVVSDGSTDGTVEAVEVYAQRFPGKIRLVAYQPNRGRGVAVREGMKVAQGDYALEGDADGSVAEEAMVRFYQHARANPEAGVVMGSRMMRGAQIVIQQSFFRVLLGNMYALLARVVFGFAVTDYALGYKMFSRAAAADIFKYQRDNHYLAETEIVVIAKHRGHRVVELPITWTDYRDSKVRPVKDSVRTLVGMAKILLRKWRGVYSV